MTTEENKIDALIQDTSEDTVQLLDAQTKAQLLEYVQSKTLEAKDLISIMAMLNKEKSLLLKQQSQQVGTNVNVNVNTNNPQFNVNHNLQLNEQADSLKILESLGIVLEEEAVEGEEDDSL